MAFAERIRDSEAERPFASEPEIGAAPGAPSCPLCAYQETKRAFRDNGRSLEMCSMCGLFFVHPYPAGSRQHACVSSGVSYEIEILDCARRYHGEQLYYGRHLREITEECSGAESLLDVGCGTGYLLQSLASQPNLYTAGIELNAQAARFARRVSGRPIYEMPFEQFRSDRKFDVIALINVLSHVPSFDGMFRSIRAAFRPGGKVILRTSEMSGNVSRWNQVHWGIPDDLHFLGLTTLDFICAKYGFVIQRHIRTPFEDELFLRVPMGASGPQPLHNFVKTAGVRIPRMLPALQIALRGNSGPAAFVSLVVLTPLHNAAISRRWAPADQQPRSREGLMPISDDRLTPRRVAVSGAHGPDATSSV